MASLTWCVLSERRACGTSPPVSTRGGHCRCRKHHARLSRTGPAPRASHGTGVNRRPPADQHPAGERVSPTAQVLGAVETRTSTLVPAAVDHHVIVSVAVTTCGQRASGTAVLIAENTILTAAHTVGDAGLVRIAHGRQVLTGEVRGVLADGRDLALIELPAPGCWPLPHPSRTLGQPSRSSGFPVEVPAPQVGPVVAVPHHAERRWTGPRRSRRRHQRRHERQPGRQR